LQGMSFIVCLHRRTQQNFPLTIYIQEQIKQYRSKQIKTGLSVDKVQIEHKLSTNLE
jgi:hypothetical protein